MKTVLRYFIAFVWIVNGLFCKVLDFVPRHQEIVGKILGTEHSYLMIKIIGCSEIMMAIWILSKYKSHFCTVFQIVIVAIIDII